MNKVELTSEAFEEIEWETALDESRREECDSFSRIFINRKKEAEENGNEEEYTLYDLLARVTSFILKPEGKQQVFVAQFSGNGSRSALPQDITDEEISLLQEVYPDAFENLEMKSRVGDLLWVRIRDHEAAKSACVAYKDSITELSNYAINKLRRALAITNMLGNAAEQERGEISDKIEELIEDNREVSEKSFWVRDLIDLLVKNGLADFEKYGELAFQIAEKEKDEGNLRKARAFWEEAAICFRKISQQEKVNDCWVEIGDSFEKEVEEEDSAMLKANNIIRAIEAYRKVPGAEEKRGNLHSKLIAIQAQIPDELSSFSKEFDITGIVRKVESDFTGLNLGDAIQKLALIKQPISYEELKKQTEENAQNFPMQHLISGSMINEMGKNVAITPSLLTTDKDEYEEALFAHMVKEAQQNRLIGVSGLIEPARKKVIEEHQINETDLFPFVRNHPMIKNGHEDLIIKGIISGFYGDWITAGHILCTQFEECLRHYFRINGIVTSGLDDQGIQQEKSLNQLFEERFLISTFGKDLVFEFHSILASNHGPNLRNKVAHGLMGYYDFYSPQVIYFWWLFLRIICLPAVTAEYEGHEREEAEAERRAVDQEE